MWAKAQPHIDPKVARICFVLCGPMFPRSPHGPLWAHIQIHPFPRAMQVCQKLFQGFYKWATLGPRPQGGQKCCLKGPHAHTLSKGGRNHTLPPPPSFPAKMPYGSWGWGRMNVSVTTRCPGQRGMLQQRICAPASHSSHRFTLKCACEPQGASQGIKQHLGNIIAVSNNTPHARHCSLRFDRWVVASRPEWHLNSTKKQETHVQYDFF